MTKKKPEGIEALVKNEPISIQEITLLDWYASFALMGIGSEAHQNATLASMAFDRAEEMLKQREKRL
jgi:hypothetical protein